MILKRLNSRRWGLALALLLAVGFAACITGRRPSALRLNQIQVIGTHNSYHRRAPDPLLNLIRRISPDLASGLDYTHHPLPEQLALGIRQIELDCFADPKGGLYASPRGPQLAAALGMGAVPHHDPQGLLRRPGFKVLHVQDVDYLSTVLTFVDALKQVRDWSAQHPGHLPIFILVELKDDCPSPGLTVPLPIDGQQMEALEQEILSVFPRDKLLVPDQVRRGEPSLPAALRRYGWPTVDSVRGKVLFGLDNGGKVRDAYLRGHSALEGRLLFVSVDPAHPAAAWMKENDAVGDFDRIQQLVRDGFLVRTRADSDTTEARSNDTRRRERAFASGAQFVSTDFPEPNPRLSAYAVRFPGDAMARINPVTGPSRARLRVP